VQYDAGVDSALDVEQSEKQVVTAAVPGIDVSHYQPAIDWATVVGAGFQYCFIKATEGSASVDKSFARHWPDARKAGLIRGAYHFFRPAVPVASQAALFLRTVKRLQPGDLPPVLDLEAPQEWADILPKERIALAVGWLEAVEHKLGATPIVYLSPSFASNILGNTTELARYPVWLAHYTMAETPMVPKPWSSWTFWQHSNGRTPGVSVPVDLNRFNGSRDDLKALTVTAPPDAG
jgi:lysozyme